MGKVGVSIGNQNAVKHSIYSKAISVDIIKQLITFTT